VARQGTKEKMMYELDGISAQVEVLLQDIQRNMYQRALAFRNDHIYQGRYLGRFYVYPGW